MVNQEILSNDSNEYYLNLFAHKLYYEESYQAKARTHLAMCVISLCLLQIWQTIQPLYDEMMLYVAIKKSEQTFFQERLQRAEENETDASRRNKTMNFGKSYLKQFQNQSLYSYKNLKNDVLSYSPWIFLLLIRVGMFIIAYAYHSYSGLAHLSWVLLSFIIPLKYVIWLTVLILFPAVVAEFILKFIYSFTYTLSVEDVSDTILTDYFFHSDMPMIELSLHFLLVIITSLMFKARQTYSKESDHIQRILFVKTQSTQTSIWWKFLFIVLKSLHYGTLFLLFIIGVSETNFYHLGFMFFFIIYVASQSLYRRTSLMLVIFASFFLWGQYYYTIVIAPKVEQNPDYIHSKEYQFFELIDWVIQEGRKYERSKDGNRHFEYPPPWIQWVILLILVSLNKVNYWFKNTEEIKIITTRCDDLICMRFPATTRIWKRFSYITQEMSVYTVIIAMTLTLTNQDPTVINWIAMIICFVILGFTLTAKTSKKMFIRCTRIATVLKFYAGTILILSVAYHLFTDQQLVNKSELKERGYALSPFIYDNLDLIGFKEYDGTEQQKKLKLWLNFASYIGFLIMGLILEQHYLGQLSRYIDEEQTNYIQVFTDEFYLKKYFEQHRFTTPFFVFRIQKWWWIIDWICTYFHIISSSLILAFALHFEVSLFMAINLYCIVFFYVISSISLHNKTYNIDKTEETLTLNKAHVIDGQFKSQASNSFLRIRKILWFIQYAIILLALVFNYPSAFFEIFEVRYPYYKSIYRHVAFYFFWGGVYKSDEGDSQLFYLLPLYTLLILIIIEKNAQKWLSERHGCSLLRIINFTEAEQRINLLKQKKELPDYEQQYTDIQNARYVTVQEARNLKTQIKDKYMEVTEDEQLRRLKKEIKTNIRFKYRISVAKGTRILVEQVCLVLLLLSSAYKANAISLFYTICVLFYLLSKNKTTAMPLIVIVIGLGILYQYMTSLLNLTSLNSPSPFPKRFSPYPQEPKIDGIYLIPIFFKINFFALNLDWTYFLGIGVESSTLRGIWLDFFNLCVVTMYFYIYRNPLLKSQIKKISWTLASHTPNKRQSQIIQKINLKAALQKYTAILASQNPAEENLTAKDRLKSLKNNIFIYYLVKRASVAIFLSFHIFTIVAILLLALLGRSIISFGYVIFLIPYIINNSTYFDQHKLVRKGDQWSFINFISYYLLIYAFADFAMQLVFQVPSLDTFEYASFFGLRKVWQLNEGFTYSNILGKDPSTSFMVLNQRGMAILMLKCCILFAISLQREIFKSSGYTDFIKSNNSGLKKLLNMIHDKRMATTYDFNNLKLKQIVMLQKKKESIFKVVQNLKTKIRIWKNKHYEGIADEQLIKQDDAKSSRQSILTSLLKEVELKKEEIAQKEQQIQEIKIKANQLGQNLQQSQQYQNVRRLVKEIYPVLPKLARLYNYLNKNFTDLIYFETNTQRMKAIREEIFNGGKGYSTVLDQIMFDDARIYFEYQQQLPDPFKEKLQLSDMKITMKFIKKNNIIGEIILTLFKIVASNAQYFAYFFMIISMFNNAGIVSLVYPLTVFGVALMEETRPKKRVWSFLLHYTVFLLIIKYILQLRITDEYVSYIDVFSDAMKIGLYRYEWTIDLILYVLPEIFIIVCILVHSIHENLIGLHDKSELEYESIKEAIYRNLSYNPKDDLGAIKNQVTKAMNKNKKLTEPFLVSEQKRYTEKKEFNEEILKTMNLNYSYSFDKEQIQIDVKAIKQKRNYGKKNFIERIEYFKRLFPTLKVQKPGSDYYAYTTTVLFILCIMTLYNYQDLDVTTSTQNNQSVFSGAMVMVLLFHITIMIVERYISRSDTKVRRRKGVLQGKFIQFKQQFFKNQLDTSVDQSRLVEPELQSLASQTLLQGLEGQQNPQTIDIEKTVMTTQQFIKIMLHWVLLIFIHIAAFWFYPMNNTYELYGSFYCKQESKYGCKNFRDNLTLQIFYIVYCLYFLCSALQIRYGLPQYKRATSLMAENLRTQIGHLIYQNIPFVIEIKTLLDWTFTKTSLDVFQWMQLNYYHSDLYLAKMANRNYFKGTLGLKITKLEKCICGVCCSFMILFLLVGPFLLFSSLGISAQYNPVQDAIFKFNINILNSEINSTMQYELYSTQNPKLKTLDSELMRKDGLMEYPETKFYEPKQVQQIKATKYSDSEWDLSQENRKSLSRSIDLVLKQKENSTLQIAAELEYTMTRKNPADAKIATGNATRYLEYHNYDDRKVLLGISKIRNLNCTKSPYAKRSLVLKDFWSKQIFLDDTVKIKGISNENFPKQSLKLTYICENQWSITDDKDHEVSVYTFSSQVAAGFLAGYSVMSFYIGVIYTISTILRPVFIFITPRAFIYEINRPDQLMDLCEYVNQMRHEENLEKEEEYYMMLVDILRSPELLKALTGSSLKGELAGNKND